MRGPGPAPGRSGAWPVCRRGAHSAWRHTRSSQVRMPCSTAVRCVLAAQLLCRADSTLLAVQCRTDFHTSGCRAVRSSALAASAALVAGIGTAAVPLLPRIARRALDVVGAALETVATAEAADAQLAEAPAAEAPGLGSPTGTGSTQQRVRSSLRALTTPSGFANH